MGFNHKDVEQKWQKKWSDENLYSAEDDSEKEKFYVLVEFPYPSGDGLHVGHCRSYTALDIVARKARMEGKNVLFPMGFDAFGLPTENYAIKNKIHPREATDKNIENFTNQLKSIGFSFDWNRVVDTTDPKYYKWTQWIFLQLYKKGLAYQAEIPINWCLSCKIGLANEEVVNGKCERCDGDIERRVKKQWMLKITEYAQRLLDDLETVDYLPRIKTQQQNWIGRSEGAEVDFQIKDLTRGELNIDFHPQYGDADGLFLITWNTITPAGIKTNEANDPEAKNFIPGEKLLNSAEKKQVILKALAEAEDKANDGFKILEAVITDNHVHAVVYISEESGGMPIVINNLKGISSRRFWEAFPAKDNLSTLNSAIHGVESDSIPAMNGRVKDREINHANCNHLWRKGYHFSALVKHANYDGAMSYIEQHAEKEKSSAFYSKLPIASRVFTTRPDTLFGCTYTVLSPEHKLVQKLKTQIKNWEEVENYIQSAAKKSDLERTELAKEKTGVELQGVKALNPVNNEEIPIFVADYILASYGTGAIMAVPAHDERDFEFAKKFNIQILDVVKPKISRFYVIEKSLDKGLISTLNKFGKIEIDKETPNWGKFFNIYISSEKESEFIEFLKNNLLEKSPDGGGWYANSENTIIFRNKVFYRNDHEYLDQARKYGLSLGVPPEQLDFEYKCFTNEGTAINSGEFDGILTTEFKNKISEWLEKKGVGKATVNFKLRDWVFSRQRYWGEPIPIIHCEKCGVIPLEEKDLPLELPHVESYKPTETGESPLATISDWVSCECPQCGNKAKRETDTMPNWAGSSWYFLRYIDPKNDQVFADQKKLKYWTPVDLYNGGMEHTVLHLLYSRFWHKFLFDEGHVPTAEPYAKRISHGMILGPDGDKMSKSRGNVINPDEIIKKHGADTLRIYEMFIGPFDQAASWSEGGVEGVSRFLDKVWRYCEKWIKDYEHVLKNKLPHGFHEESVDNLLNKELHKLINKVSQDLENIKFNTSVAEMMSFMNQVRYETDNGKIETATEKMLTKPQLEKFLTILAPFAPHLTEELWEKLGNKKSIHLESWPKYDPKLVVDDTIELVIQVNGKLRDTIEVSADITKDEAIELAKKAENIQKWLEGKEIKKEIFVSGKLVNLVV